MRILFIYSLFFISLNGWLLGQASEATALEPDPAESAAFTWALDSLPFHEYPVLSMSEEEVARYEAFNYAPDSVPRIPHDSSMQWLIDLGSKIPMDYNEYVQSYIDMYVFKRREQVSRMLGLQYLFFPIFEEELDRQGMPMELKYLPIVESALNPHARSRVGATGLWQFMYNTGKLYGLKVDSYIDERQDPHKATEAAVRYLKNMYKSYGDWLLVIAAYNCGPGNVNKAIRRSGGHKNFWAIREYLPRETRGYVPAFIAANYVMQYAPEHNIRPTLLDFTYMVDTILLHRQNLTIDQVAAYTDSDIHEIKDLNPELKTHAIPYTKEPYPLKVSFKTGALWAANKDSIFKLIAVNDSIKAAMDSIRVSPITRTKYASGTGTPDGDDAGKPSGTVLVWHTVRSGEVVGKIAEKYHVSAAQVANWNDLYRYRIKVGQKLKIYMPKKYAYRPDPQPVKNSEPPKELSGKTTYTVKDGDTLWDIAAKFEGVSVERIMAINSLSSSRLKVGQTLVIEK